ncbi:hypothetical protein GCM10011371_08790 [Novosphingobium marinum]|nr:hypothetical protein GCM10011371_08790 [Novosphingobium marinum]
MGMRETLKQLLADRKGTSAVEMGLLLGLVVLAMLSAIQGVADENTKMWQDVATKSSEAIAKTR